MATIKYDIKQEIMRFLQREDQMNLAATTIEMVETYGGAFGGQQHERWLQMRQDLIQSWMDGYLGSHAKLTTWKELDAWADEANVPVTLIINNFGHLCKDGYGRKPSKNSVIMMAQQIWTRKGRRM